MKILIIGLGSIGRRHLSCLQRIGGLDLAAFRTAKGTLFEQSDIKEFFSRSEALQFKPEGVIVANPTALHVDESLPFLENGIPVLIEKPLAASLVNANQLRPYQHLIRVAYVFRFSTVSRFLKTQFETDRPFKVSYKRSFYLPKWHSYADYTKEYTARKDLGGGVLRTLSHEIDLALDMFGYPIEVLGLTDRLSTLKIDVDDFALLSMKMRQGVRVNLELDYFSPQNINFGEAITETGKYEWNIDEVFFQDFRDSEKCTLLAKENESFDENYFRQINDFLQFVETGVSLNASYADGVETLRIIETVDSLSKTT